MSTIIADRTYLSNLSDLVKGVVTQNDAELVIGGSWSEDSFHEGYSTYLIHRSPSGTWVLVREDRNACLDSVTEEDIEEGHLNDDQAQALWNRTLEEAQNARWTTPVALALSVNPTESAEEVIVAMYRAAIQHDAPEPTEDLSIGPWPSVAQRR